MESGPATLYNKFLVGYLYFIQGVFLVIPSTTTLTYKSMPDYGILSFFSMSIIPFSLKFLSAPLVERYTCSSYGRRKTWVVLSLLLTSILMVVGSFFTA